MKLFANKKSNAVICTIDDDRSLYSDDLGFDPLKEIWILYWAVNSDMFFEFETQLFIIEQLDEIVDITEFDELIYKITHDNLTHLLISILNNGNIKLQLTYGDLVENYNIRKIENMKFSEIITVIRDTDINITSSKKALIQKLKHLYQNNKESV